MRHDAPWKRTLGRRVRHLLGVPDEESLAGFLGERGARMARGFERLLQGLGIAPPPPGGDGRTVEPRAPWPEPNKFDLGPEVDRGPVREHIAWGYGENRVTAMPVDPDRLFVYWELTDDAIAAARRGLGDGGETAWPSLRVYDVTGRIFDGSNAHAYFDHRVERHDRQWFLSLGRPGHSVCVDVGMKSLEGYFVRIARSARVDLPRAEPAPAATAEWMTVRVQAGGIEGACEATTPPPEPVAIVADGTAAGGSTDGTTDGVAARARALDGGADPGRTAAGHGGLAAAPGAQGATCHMERIGNVERVSWQAGPFARPVAPPRYEVTVEHSGAVRTVETPPGRIVIEQPWSVTIRGVGAHVVRRVIGRWEIVRAVSAPAKPAATEGVLDARQAQPDERRLGEWRGASEVGLASGSELRLGGASEEFFVGASELRFGGASERLVPGASERRWGGAGERTWLGASEVRQAGASERITRAASDQRLGGDAPPRWQEARANEHRIGADERRLGGAGASASTSSLGGAASDAGQSPLGDGAAGGSKSLLGGAAAGSSESPLGGAAAGARSARASWQAFAAAGSRLVPPPGGRISPGDRAGGPLTAPGPSATPDPRGSSPTRGAAGAARR